MAARLFSRHFTAQKLSNHGKSLLAPALLMAAALFPSRRQQLSCSASPSLVVITACLLGKLKRRRACCQGLQPAFALLSRGNESEPPLQQLLQGLPPPSAAVAALHKHSSHCASLLLGPLCTSTHPAAELQALLSFARCLHCLTLFLMPVPLSATRTSAWAQRIIKLVLLCCHGHLASWAKV